MTTPRGTPDERDNSQRGRAERLAKQADLLSIRAAVLGGLSDAEWVAFAADAGVVLNLKKVDHRKMCGKCVDLVQAAEEAEILTHRKIVAS